MHLASLLLEEKVSSVRLTDEVLQNIMCKHNAPITFYFSPHIQPFRHTPCATSPKRGGSNVPLKKGAPLRGTVAERRLKGEYLIRLKFSPNRNPSTTLGVVPLPLTVTAIRVGIRTRPLQDI